MKLLIRLFGVYPTFERVLDGDMCNEFRDFLVEELHDCYPTLSELKDNIHHIDIPKKKITSKNILFSDKLIAFIYSSFIKFCRTHKIKGIPLSKIFIENLKGIMNNSTHIHHLHIISGIIWYAHSFCDIKITENQNKIAVIAHNLFRFHFFFLLKCLRAVFGELGTLVLVEKIQLI